MNSSNQSAAPSQPASPWIITPRVNPQATWRLFCFPYAGGSAQIYRAWATALPNTVEVCAVELPGRGRRLREENHTDLLTLVAEILAALKPYLDKPCAFFGHSMGALISFELARLIRRQGLDAPVQLFVSARGAPQIPETERLTYNLPEPDFIAELRRLDGTPNEVLEHEELLQLLLPMLRADFSVCQTYSYRAEPPLATPITAFGGSADIDVSIGQLSAWKEQTNDRFKLRMLPGDHFFIHSCQSPLLQLLTQETHELARKVMLKG